MRYGHGAKDIIGITLKPPALKQWALSMHVCTKLIKHVADMTGGYEQVDVATHKKDKPSRIRADNKDQMNIKENL